MADNAMTYRLVVKEVALKHGVYATFMPSPFLDRTEVGCIPINLFSRVIRMPFLMPKINSSL